MKSHRKHFFKTNQFTSTRESITVYEEYPAGLVGIEGAMEPRSPAEQKTSGLSCTGKNRITPACSLFCTLEAEHGAQHLVLLHEHGLQLALAVCLVVARIQHLAHDLDAFLQTRRQQRVLLSQRIILLLLQKSALFFLFGA